jgi:hypothetical protein
MPPRYTGAMAANFAVRRHYRIFVALEEDHGTRKALGVKKRRTFTIEYLVLGVRADQPIEVVRLEPMGIARKRGDIAHAVITGAASEHLVEHERSERCVAAESPTYGRSSMPVGVVAREFRGRGVGTIHSARKFSASWARLNCPAR